MDDLSNTSLKAYEPSDATKKLISDMPILLIVGPTGAGKDTLQLALLKTNKFRKIITHTTRPPRMNHGVMELTGHDYHFINPAQAKKMLDDQLFIEAAIIHGNLYGTSASEFKATKDQSKIAIADIDVQGVKSYRQLSKKTMSIFLLPPSFEVMLKRLSLRYGHADHDKDINVRLGTALDELYELLDYRYYHAVINDDLKQTIETAKSIVKNNYHDTKEDEQARHLARKLIEDIKKYIAASS
jgi:guanylate kinase